MRIFHLIFGFCLALNLIGAQSNIPTSAPLTTDFIGKESVRTFPAVFRIINLATNKAGTGFLFRKEKVLTAAHVVDGATGEQILIIDSTGRAYRAKALILDTNNDIGCIVAPPINAEPLEFSSDAPIKIGAVVGVWGYPMGYYGNNAFLTVGYLGGFETIKPSKEKPPVNLAVFNAAFNSGNSGGPIIDGESGKVVGIVSAKMAPLPDDISAALVAMKNNPSGVVYTATDSSGKTQKPQRSTSCPRRVGIP